MKALRIAGLTALFVVAGVFGVRIVYNAKTVGPAKVGATDINVRLSGFSPDSVQVTARTTVRWHFHDTIEHDVVGDGLKSARMADGTYQFTFTQPGTYDYHCTMHPLMRGRVIVT